MIRAFENVAQIVRAKEREQPLRLVGRHVERQWQTIDDPVRVSSDRTCEERFSRLVGR